MVLVHVIPAVWYLSIVGRQLSLSLQMVYWVFVCHMNEYDRSRNADTDMCIVIRASYIQRTSSKRIAIVIVHQIWPQVIRPSNQ